MPEGGRLQKGEGGAMRIGSQSVGTAANMVTDLLVSKKTLKKMNEGLLCSEDESLTVTIKVKFSPGERKPVKVDATMTFPVEKHKEELKDEVDEMQISMSTDVGDCGNLGDVPKEFLQD
jgi:hypothetical protein